MRKLLFICWLSIILLYAVYSKTTQFSFELISKFEADINGYGQIGFSPNGKYFFALSYKKNLQIWETESQKRLYALNGKFVYGAKFSPDGKLLAVFSEKEGLVFETETGKTQLNINTYKEKIHFLNWSPNSRKFVVGTENFVVDVWNTETGKTENSFKIHEKKQGFWVTDEPSIYSIIAEFSSDGKRLLTNCDDYEAEYWDLESGKLIYAFKNGNAFYSPKLIWVKTSPDGKWIITSSEWETRLWDAQAVVLIKSFNSFSYPTFSPDSRYLGIVTDPTSANDNILFDLSTRQSFLTFEKEYKNYANSISNWSPDGKTFTTNSVKGSIWSLETGRLINIFDSRMTYEFFVGYFPDDFYNYDPSGKVLMVQNGKELRFFSSVRNEQLPLSLNAKRPASWSPDGRFLLARVKGESKIALWKVIEK